MTLTINKSRRIDIDDMTFRYQISTTRIDDNWNFSLNLTVQKWNPPEGILQVKGLITRDFWLDISDGAKWNIGDYPIILPKHIHLFIKQAISYGWDYTVKGKPFTLHTS